MVYNASAQWIAEFELSPGKKSCAASFYSSGKIDFRKLPIIIWVKSLRSVEFTVGRQKRESLRCIYTHKSIKLRAHYPLCPASQPAKINLKFSEKYAVKKVTQPPSCWLAGMSPQIKSQCPALYKQPEGPVLSAGDIPV